MKSITIILCLFFSLVDLNAAELKLSEFLDEVAKGNQGYTSAQKGMEAGEKKSEEGDLMLAYTFFANYQNSNDKRESNFAFVTGDRVTNNTLSFGFNKMTSFGFTGSLHYDISYTYMHGANSTFLNSDRYYETRPVLEFKQSLWQNAFGRQTRAAIEATDAKNISSSYSLRFTSKKVLAEAETLYWNLSVTKQLVSILKDNLVRAEKLRDWSKRRSGLNLADNVDFLQAEANVKMSQLELQASMDEEKELTRAFNTARGVDSDVLDVEMELLSVDTIVGLSTPERKGVRDDVVAYREAARASAANAKLSKDRNKPTLELFSTLSLNGRDPNFDPSFKESWGGSYPYTVIGLKFSSPLDFGNIGRVNSGYELDKISSEYLYERKSFEADREWDNLGKKINDLKNRLKIAKEAEDAQYKKYTYEQNRHKLGRTTTYQVIMFEKDYATSQAVRLRLQALVLQTIANMKLFEGQEG